MGLALLIIASLLFLTIISDSLIAIFGILCSPERFLNLNKSQF